MDRSQVENAVLADLCYGPPHPAQEFLCPEDFSPRERRALYEAIVSLRRDGITAPGILAVEFWLDEHAVDVPGMALALADLACGYHVLENVRAKIEVLKRLSAREDLSQMGGRLLKGDHTTHEMLSDAVVTTQHVTEILNRDDTESQDQVLDSMLTEDQQGPDPRSLRTGFHDLDALGPTDRGSITVIGARTSIGKTSFATSVSLNVAVSGHGVCYIAAEETPRAILGRLARSYAGLAGLASNAEGLRALRALPISVRHARRLPQIALAVSDAQAERGCELVVIDHLQELHAERPDDRIREIGELLRGIRQLASERNVAVMLLSQLSRRQDARKDRRPELSDLRDSGEIENVADRVGLLHREDRSSTSAQLAVLKNRLGPQGLVSLTFLPEQTRFVSAARDSEPFTQSGDFFEGR